MGTQSTTGKIRFDEQGEIENSVECQLKRKYGRGVFVDNYTQTSDGTVFIELGNASPKDVSDCRDHDRVLKFIEYESIYQIKAEPVESGYLIDLPTRKEVHSGFLDQKRKLARRLDRSMAKAIYEKLVSFPEVENQLGAIKAILRTVREEAPIPVETIHDVRGTAGKEREKTEAYIRLLADTEFLRVEKTGAEIADTTLQDTLGNNSISDDNHEERILRAGKNLDAYDEKGVGTDEFNKIVLGQVIDKAYSTLKDERNLTLLAHYPKFANAYYFTALERNKPDVHLDAERARENIKSLYGDDENEILVRQKLDDLADVGVVQKEGEFYQSNSDVYQALSEKAVV
jgi:hypothetical protein